MQGEAHVPATRQLVQDLERDVLLAPGAHSWGRYSAALAGDDRKLEACEAAFEATRFDRHSAAREVIPLGWAAFGRGSVPWRTRELGQPRRLDVVSRALPTMHGKWVDLGRGTAAFMPMTRESYSRFVPVEPRELFAVDLLADTVLWRHSCPGLDPRSLFCLADRVYGLRVTDAMAELVSMDARRGIRGECWPLGGARITLAPVGEDTVAAVVGSEMALGLLAALPTPPFEIVTLPLPEFEEQNRDPSVFAEVIAVDVAGASIAVASGYGIPTFVFDSEGRRRWQREANTMVRPIKNAFVEWRTTREGHTVLRLLDPVSGEPTVDRAVRYPWEFMCGVAETDNMILTAWEPRNTYGQITTILALSRTKLEPIWSISVHAFAAAGDAVIAAIEPKCDEASVTVLRLDALTGEVTAEARAPYTNTEPDQIRFGRTGNPMLVGGRVFVQSAAGFYALDGSRTQSSDG